MAGPSDDVPVLSFFMNRVGHPRNHVNHVMFVYIETAGRAGRNPCVFVKELHWNGKKGRPYKLGHSGFPPAGGFKRWVPPVMLRPCFDRNVFTRVARMTKTLEGRKTMRRHFSGLPQPPHGLVRRIHDMFDMPGLHPSCCRVSRRRPMGVAVGGPA